MLTFFPDPYPDELLYGVFSRYHIRSGNDSFKRTQRELFGCNSGIAIKDFPCRIGNLIKRLPAGAKYTGRQLIDNHTVFPFYQPFLPSQRVKLIVSDMLSETGGGIHMRVGEMASTVTSIPYLRFCPGCLKEDEEKFGEPYWHRFHQLPGVYVCREHKLFLKTGCAQCKNPFLSKHRQEYMVLNMFCENGHPLYLLSTARSADNKGILGEQLLSFALDAWSLISAKPNFGEPEALTARYIVLLQERELATPSGRVRQKELHNTFTGFYSGEFLRAMGSYVDGESEQSWLADIFRKPRKAIHPIRHLFVMRFLASSVPRFIGLNNREYKPFGDEPWPCLNPVADHYKEPVVHKCEITVCTDTSLPVGTFSCDCGFVYSRRGPDSCMDDRFKIGRIKSFGHVWESELACVINECYGLRETARQMNADPKTIKKYARKLGLKLFFKNDVSLTPDQPMKETNAGVGLRLSEQIQRRRQELIAAQSELGSHTRTEMRRAVPGTYTWLYRHDREWLEAVLPPSIPRGKRKGGAQKQRVDWNKRDRDLSGLVSQTVEDLLLKEGKPVRITLGIIGRAIGELALLEQHLDKLPKTKAVLEDVLETVEDFQVRRVEWAIGYLKETGQELAEWRVLKVAGLRPDISDRVRQAIKIGLHTDLIIQALSTISCEVTRDDPGYQV